MKTSNNIQAILLALMLALLTAQVCGAESMYEYYSRADRATLEDETREMGNELRKIFNQQDISAKQRDIDFAEYAANLKKLVFYGNKLATYSDYERDLSFARDKEIFKGLPEERKNTPGSGPRFDRKSFAGSKYERMKVNVEEEIDTYHDLIRMSLDICQAIIENDLTGIHAHQDYHDRIQRFMNSKAFRLYQERRKQMAGRWPDIAAQIDAQFRYWETKAPALDEPIISTAITGRL